MNPFTNAYTRCINIGLVALILLLWSTGWMVNRGWWTLSDRWMPLFSWDHLLKLSVILVLAATGLTYAVWGWIAIRNKRREARDQRRDS